MSMELTSKSDTALGLLPITPADGAQYAPDTAMAEDVEQDEP